MKTLDMDKFIKELETVVNIDSGSYNIAGVNKVQDWFEKQFTQLGWKATAFYPEEPIVGRGMLYSKGDDHNFDLLVLCHVDTVFPEGEVAKRPFTVEKDELKGPGVADMKAGCLCTLYAVQELLKNNELGNVGVFMNSDEEISSTYMRKNIESVIKKSRIVIGGEPARPNGGFVKRRKGMARFEIKFTGIAAHSGNNPYGGACAVEELAHWILKIKSFDNKDKGLSINTGIAKGGTSANSIPDTAELLVTARMQELEDAIELEKSIRGIKPFNPKVTVEISGGVRRPPMVPNAKTEILCEMAEKIGKKYGINVQWLSAGGGADTSFATLFGIPALCGLTPMYRDSHTADEALLLKEIHERYAIYRDIIKEFSLMSNEALNGK